MANSLMLMGYRTYAEYKEVFEGLHLVPCMLDQDFSSMGVVGSTEVLDMLRIIIKTQNPDFVEYKVTGLEPKQ